MTPRSSFKRGFFILGVAGASAAAAGCASGGEADTSGPGQSGAGGSVDGGDGSSAAAGTSSAGSSGASGVGGGSAGDAGSGNAAGASGASAASGGGGESGSSGTSGTAGAGGDAGAAGSSGGMAGAAGTGSGETCNGIDDNGDGRIDEGNPGGGGACVVPGKAGLCAAGTLNCPEPVNGGNGTLQCTQVNQPSVEICDGMDNDCNGAPDQGNPGGLLMCNTGLTGVCSLGTTQCVAGMIQCNQNNQSSTETCNSLDDDCNGAVDENNPGGGVPCSTGLLGECAPGTRTCSSGQLLCIQTTQSGPELCDSRDNDCDGNFDEDLNGVPCMTGLPGICGSGSSLCSMGTSSCTPTTAPGSVLESCNNQDDDCNSTVDDGNAATLCARTCMLAVIPNVQTMACVSPGSCIIVDCPPGLKNDDGNFCNGCEATTCSTSPANTTCGGPDAISPAVSPVTGQLITTGETAWFSVSFSSPGAGSPWSPRIQLTQGASQYRMDVLSSACGGTPISCPVAGGTGSGSGNDAADWSMDFNTNLGNCGGAMLGPCTNSSALPSPIFVKITREVITGDACDPFQIAVTQ